MQGLLSWSKSNQRTHNGTSSNKRNTLKAVIIERSIQPSLIATTPSPPIRHPFIQRIGPLLLVPLCIPKQIPTRQPHPFQILQHPRLALPPIRFFQNLNIPLPQGGVTYTSWALSTSMNPYCCNKASFNLGPCEINTSCSVYSIITSNYILLAKYSNAAYYGHLLSYRHAWPYPPLDNDIIFALRRIIWKTKSLRVESKITLRHKKPVRSIQALTQCILPREDCESIYILYGLGSNAEPVII